MDSENAFSMLVSCFPSHSVLPFFLHHKIIVSSNQHLMSIFMFYISVNLVNEKYDEKCSSMTFLSMTKTRR